METFDIIMDLKRLYNYLRNNLEAPQASQEIYTESKKRIREIQNRIEGIS